MRDKSTNFVTYNSELLQNIIRTLIFYW